MVTYTLTREQLLEVAKKRFNEDTNTQLSGSTIEIDKYLMLQGIVPDKPKVRIGIIGAPMGASRASHELFIKAQARDNFKPIGIDWPTDEHKKTLK